MCVCTYVCMYVMLFHFKIRVLKGIGSGEETCKMFLSGSGVLYCILGAKCITAGSKAKIEQICKFAW